VYGGILEQSVVSQELWKFSLDDNIWQQIEVWFTAFQLCLAIFAFCGFLS
jgi:hypothetical protein